MKHTVKVVFLLLFMFFLAQLIGLYVSNQYAPQVTQVVNETSGQLVNSTVYNLPYGFEPPSGIEPQNVLFSIIMALVIAVVLMLTLMKFRAEIILRVWFFVVISVGIAVTLNSFLLSFAWSSIAAIIISVPLAFLKVFKRNIIVHNVTEVLVYPGIASIFIPLLNIWTAITLLIIISIYDIYAVWHAGFMQKMAQYQIKKLRIFSGFFVPYVNKKDRALVKQMRNQPKSLAKKKINVQVAILGGGDVVFPIILAGVVYNVMGLYAAFLISVGATAALALLFYFSEKGKYYPAMPFISAGCLAALALAYLLF